MTNQTKWLPTDEEIHLHLIHEGGIRFISDYCRIVSDLLRAAVEKALAEQRDLLTAAFELQLSEQEARHRREVLEARSEEIVLWAPSDPETINHLATLRAELAALEVKP